MAEFWQEEAIEGRREMRRQALRWSLVFGLLIAGVVFALWWAGSAVHFSASRVEATTGPSYQVTGVVLDSRSGAPVAWAEITDEPTGRPPFFHSMADRFGSYSLSTVAEPHHLVVSALGYHAGRVAVGKKWYVWMPQGAEVANVKLQPE